MDTHLKSLLLVVILFLLINISVSAQGQIFTNAQADNLFGPVLTSIPVSKITFRSFLTRTENYIMFKIINNKAIVLDNNRNVISPEGFRINSGDTFTYYKVSVASELISKGNENTVYIQQRANVLSISSGGYTMEVGVQCPPFCP